MNLSLNHADIVEAIESFVADQGVKVENKTMAVTLTCGRGANATTATVELIAADSLAAGPEENAKVPEKTTKPKAKPKAKKAVEREVSAEPEEKAEPVQEATVDTTGGLFDD